MNLADIGEFGFIDRIADRFGISENSGIIGIGDDCAVIPETTSEALLVTTDLLIENIHFLKKAISPADLGHKALSVNLSDIAAMGGIPTSAFLSIALPSSIDLNWIDEFLSGMEQLAKAASVSLLGGDTTHTKLGIVINICVLGKAKKKNIKYRYTAVPGDVICVTGVTGDSAGGLDIILNHWDKERDEIDDLLIHAHHHPNPHLKQGFWLAQQTAVHAMLDVSDGVDSDIQRIMGASKVGARINIERLPVTQSFLKAAERYHWDSHEMALSGGEDYCLMCTVDPGDIEILSAQFNEKFQHPLQPIGSILDNRRLEYYHHNKPVKLLHHGWDHFKQGS